jgi:poly(3-hydroxybutyrate) depolymerase
MLNLALLPVSALAARDARVDFTLNTADPYGNPLQESRYYYVYRPDNLPMTTSVPMLLILEDSPNTGPQSFFHTRADQAGFILVSCSFSGNTSGTPGSGWIADDPRIVGYEDHDYLSAVINQVAASNNANDAFIAGVSKGGHMSLAYACVRPSMIRAAGSIDEFMGLTSNLPSAPVPIIFMQGTADSNVPLTMVKDTADAWRAADGLLSVTPITTYEASPLMPGMVSQATWADPDTGLQVAFVTIIGGTHAEGTPTVQTGYDSSVGLWNFFSQYLTPAQDSPQIVSQPVNNVQVSGQAASFWIQASSTRPVSVQWQKNGVDIPGAIDNWYTAPSTSAADNGSVFRAVVRTDSGTVTSAPAKLTVTPAPSDPQITAQPADIAVVAGQPVSFIVAAAGTGPFTYQWRKNGVNIAGAAAAELDLPAASTSDCGESFSVVVTGSAGSVVSSRATLTVTPAPGGPIILANPARQRVVVNQQGTFSVTAWSPSSLSYQWQKGTILTNMADIPGANSPAYTTPQSALTDTLTLFGCTVTNATGSITSADEFLFVTAGPAAPNAFSNLLTASAQTGVPFTYTIVASGGTTPLTYTASPLPAGLSLDKNSGVISGIPVAAGVSSISIGASNSAGHTSAILTLTVTDTPPPVSISDWRAATFGASALDPTIAGDLADPDGDGYANADEFTFGSDPLNGASVPTALSASPASFDFGTVAIGNSAQATFTITNTGPATFSGTATVSGTGFAIPLGSAFIIDAGASAAVVVTFTPTAAGTATGQVTFTSNGGSATASLAGGGGVAANQPTSSACYRVKRTIARAALLMYCDVKASTGSFSYLKSASRSLLSGMSGRIPCWSSPGRGLGP